MAPLLSLLFPLYRSKPYLENIIYNIEQLAGSDYEIIISDRHCEDDALEVLQKRYGSDKRFRFVSEKDQVGWVVHYNDLMLAAAGRYFCWVPHDDEYASGYFEQLVSELENSEAAMAFSVMNTSGTKWKPDDVIYKNRPAYPFTARYYVKLLQSEMLGIPFRGIFRREHVISRKLYIPGFETVRTFNDQYWIFALLLSGDFIYSDRTSCTKRYNNSSAHSGWQRIPLLKRGRGIKRLISSYVFKSQIAMFRKITLLLYINLKG